MFLKEKTEPYLFHSDSPGTGKTQLGQQQIRFKGCVNKAYQRGKVFSSRLI